MIHNRFILGGIILLLSLPMSAIGDQPEIFERAKEAIKETLRDPESARFSNLYIGKDDNIVCGYVNAKNVMGGYVGRRPFYYGEGETTLAEISSGPDDAGVNLMLEAFCAR